MKARRDRDESHGSPDGSEFGAHNIDQRRRVTTTAIKSCTVAEGRLYAPAGSEDGCLVVCDFGVEVELADGRRFVHATFSVVGWYMDEFAQADRFARDRAARFAYRVERAGRVDLSLWTEIPTCGYCGGRHYNTEHLTDAEEAFNERDGY